MTYLRPLLCGGGVLLIINDIWIRKRIGAPSGGLITKQMLDNYGKTYVTFRKYEDGTYLLDF